MKYPVVLITAFIASALAAPAAQYGTMDPGGNPKEEKRERDEEKRGAVWGIWKAKREPEEDAGKASWFLWKDKREPAPDVIDPWKVGLWKEKRESEDEIPPDCYRSGLC